MYRGVYIHALIDCYSWASHGLGRLCNKLSITFADRLVTNHAIFTPTQCREGFSSLLIILLADCRKILPFAVIIKFQTY